MSRKLSLLSLCCLLLISGATTVIAETAAPADSKTSVAAERCGRCGDGSCVKSCGETAANCPSDCGWTKSAEKAEAAECAATEAPAKKE